MHIYTDYILLQFDPNVKQSMAILTAFNIIEALTHV